MEEHIIKLLLFPIFLTYDQSHEQLQNKLILQSKARLALLDVILHLSTSLLFSYPTVVPDENSRRKITGDQGLEFGRPHVERGVQTYNGSLWAGPSAGSGGRAPSQGVTGAKPPKAERLIALLQSEESANLS